MDKKYRRLLDYIYPPVCPICALAHPGGICPDCRKKISFIDKDYCLKCGRPLEDSRSEYCKSCRGSRRYFAECRALLEYKGDVKASIYRMKSANRREYAYIYGEEMAVAFAGWIRHRKIDLIVPVPLYRKREIERGYNQAALMARGLGEELDIAVDENLIIRSRDTGVQKALDAKARRQNVQGAFSLSGRAVPGRRILLVDDVFTTGSTLDSAAKCISEGTGSVVYAAAAAAVG